MLVGQQRPNMMVFFKAFAVTVMGAYPLALLVSTLSSIDASKFEPCDRPNQCFLLRLIGDEYIPSTVNLHSNPFVLVRNGHEKVGGGASKLLPASCPGKSASEMQTVCASSDAKENIQNTMKNGTAKTAYIASIAGWFFCKFLHDFLLLLRVDEFVTLLVASASLAFQVLAVCAGFLWSMGAAEVFASPQADGSCACYYQLEEMETLIAIATPAVLYQMLCVKSEAVLRAAVAGDYLHFMMYDVPHRLVTQAKSDPTGSYLVSNSCGTQAPEDHPGLTRHQLRVLLQINNIILFVPGGWLQSFAVGISVGPVLFRLMLLAAHAGDTSIALTSLMCFAALLLVALAAYSSYFLSQKVFDFKSWQVSAKFSERPILTRIGHAMHVGLVVPALWVAALTMIAPLLIVAVEGSATFDTMAAFRCALAGITLFVFAVNPIYRETLRPARVALSMKARVPLPPHEYVEFENYHEFGCEEEVRLARRFLESHRATSGAAATRKEWERALGWRSSCSVQPECCVYSPNPVGDENNSLLVS